MYIFYEVKQPHLPVDPKIVWKAQRALGHVGYIAPEDESSVDFSTIDYVTLTDEQGRDGWKWWQNYTGYITIAKGSTIHENQIYSSREKDEHKVRYTLTEDDLLVGLEFQKIAYKWFIDKYTQGREDVSEETKNTLKAEIDATTSLVELTNWGHYNIGMVASKPQIEGENLGTSTSVF